MSFEDAKRMSQGLPPLNDTYPDISDDQVNDILDHLPEEEDDDILNAYRDWKKNCAKETSPTATVFLLGDMDMLDYVENKLPWIMRVKTELPTRELRADGTEYPVKASFIQWGLQEGDPDEYAHFEKSMEKIGIFSCRKILQPCRRKDMCTELDKSHIEESDLVCIAGSSDLYMAWNRMEETAIGEQLRWRYYDGAVLMATGSATALVGERVLPSLEKDRKYITTFKTYNIIPYLLSHTEEPLRTILTDQNWGHGLQIGPGSGLIFTRDGFYEPVKAWVKELQWKWEDEEIKECYFIPPPRGSGTIMAVKAYLAGGGTFDVKEEDKAMAYKDAAEEEAHSEMLQKDLITIDRQEAAVELKDLGNAQFKAGNLEGAMDLYQQAVEADPNNHAVFLNMANIQIKLERWAEAVSSSNMAAKLDSGRGAKAWYRRAQARKELDLAADAFYDASEALKRDPSSTEIKKLKQLMEQQMQQDKEDFYFEKHEEVDAAWAATVAAEPTDILVLGPDDQGAGAAQAEDAQQNVHRAIIRGGSLWVWQEFFKTLKNLHTCKIGVVIGVEGCRFLCEGLKNHEHIGTLDLSYCGIRTVGAQVLANALAQNTSVTTLNLAGNSLRDEGVSTLVRNGLEENTRLMDLNLSANGVSGGGLTALGELLGNPKSGQNIVNLQLNENLFSGGAARNFATQLRENETLQELSIASSALPADVIWRLVLVCAAHPELQSLDLRGHALSGPMVSRLRERTRSKRVKLLTGEYELQYPKAFY